MENASYELIMLTIQQNNAAVRMLKEGRAMEAFQLLSRTCRDAHAARSDEHPSYHRMYQYTWRDCSKALAHKMKGTRNFSEGSISFLALQFLSIEDPFRYRQKDKQVSVQEFLWVLWYNLAIVSILVGSPVGAPGIGLLHQSLDLFRLVQSVVVPEPLSKHWLMLKLSILNNEACVHNELAQSHESFDRLVKMGLALSKMSGLLDPKEQERFLWTVKTMVDTRYAAAA
ncbi:MAG: hypothetical protein SGBAC_011846 [Bacillariaceae sp.]